MISEEITIYLAFMDIEKTIDILRNVNSKRARRQAELISIIHDIINHKIIVNM